MTTRGENVGQNEFPQPHIPLRFVTQSETSRVSTRTQLQLQALNTAADLLWTLDAWFCKHEANMPTTFTQQSLADFRTQARNEYRDSKDAVNMIYHTLQAVALAEIPEYSNSPRNIIAFAKVSIKLRKQDLKARQVRKALLGRQTLAQNDHQVIALHDEAIHERLGRIGMAFHDVQRAWNKLEDGLDDHIPPQEFKTAFHRASVRSLVHMRNCVGFFSDYFPKTWVGIEDMWQQIAFNKESLEHSGIQVEIPEREDLWQLGGKHVEWLTTWIFGLWENIAQNAIEEYERGEGEGRIFSEKKVSVSFRGEKVTDRSEGQTMLLITITHSGLQFTQDIIDYGFEVGRGVSSGVGRRHGMAFHRQAIQNYGGELFPQNTDEGSQVIILLPFAD